MSEELILTKTSIEKEKIKFNEIVKSIGEYHPYVVKAGAGSGKTYSLVETISYVIKNYREQMTTHNQKILCITYTNVAAETVKTRIGNTTIAKVSTIHEFLWEFIKPYQTELIIIHKEYIREKIIEEEMKLQESKLGCYTDDEKELFKEIVEDYKDSYYKNRHKPADDFRASFPDRLEEHFNEITTNLNNFRKIVNSVFRINSYNKTVENIESKKDDYNHVIYDTMYDFDSLSQMRISHDTLLEYSLRLINRYERLKRIIIDKHPFVFIDEYQDTDEKIISFFNEILSYKENYRNEFVVGLYGDEYQNIYDTGIGNRLNDIIPDIRIITKDYNYRSSRKIINVNNRIREDEVKQETSYVNNYEGSIEFIQTSKGNSESEKYISEIIEKYKKKWNVNQDNKLACFITLNKYLAQHMDFLELYDFFNQSPYYKEGQNYKLVNSHTLNENVNELGSAQTKIYNIMKFYTLINNNHSPILEIIPKSIVQKLNYSELSRISKKLKEIKGSTLKEFINNAIKISQTSDEDIQTHINGIVKYHFDFNPDENKNWLLNDLIFNFSNDLVTKNISDENLDIFIKNIETFFDSSIKLFLRWFEFLTESTDEDLIYSTIHGAKGDEFDNVLIFLEEDFGNRNKGYFKKMFSNLSSYDVLDDEDRKAINLFYVAVTRAIKNTTIIYFGDLTEKGKKNVTRIFGEIS